MTILILGASDDAHALHILGRLRERGQAAELLDSRWFPTEMCLAQDPRANRWWLQLPEGRVLEPGSVSAVYWRNYHGVDTPDLPDEEQALIAANDARSLFESFLAAFPARWVNGWEGYLLHQTKPAALARVAALGVAIPATVSGNDPDQVRTFASSETACIFKPVQGGAHAQRLSERHLEAANLRHLELAPVTVQEEIPGTNIRAFVAGSRVLACEVRADTLDFRDTPDPEIVPHALPPEMEEQCRRIAQALHLVWTGIDFRLTPDGRYVFLEANPSPMFLGFELRSRLPLTEALLELLLNDANGDRT
ncbi:MAG: hypothetical protein U0840_09020 [Gemmataceae bacterium]